MRGRDRQMGPERLEIVRALLTAFGLADGLGERSLGHERVHDPVAFGRCGDCQIASA